MTLNTNRLQCETESDQKRAYPRHFVERILTASDDTTEVKIICWQSHSNEVSDEETVYMAPSNAAIQASCRKQARNDGPAIVIQQGSPLFDCLKRESVVISLLRRYVH